MKKQIALVLIALSAASSAFASGSPVVNCKVPGNSDRIVYVGLSERDANTETSYNADVISVSIMDDGRGSLQNDLTPADKNANEGYYLSKAVKDGNTTKTTFEKLKVRIKSTEGSVIAIDGSGNGGKDGMEATMTVILRGKDANGTDIKDLRSVSTTCAYDYE